MRRLFLRDERASAAVEFALVVPVLFTLLFGIISLSVQYYTQAALHEVAERTARYWATSDAGWTISSTCTFVAPAGTTLTTPPIGTTSGSCDAAATGYTKPSDYAKNNYVGASVTGLTFTPTTGQCTAGGGTFGGPGVIVTATGTYNFNAMFLNIPVSLYTQACYPIIQ